MQHETAGPSEAAEGTVSRRHDALHALLEAMQEQGAPGGQTRLLLAAIDFGEAVAADHCRMEDAFALLLDAWRDADVPADPAVLGATVRGYTDYMVRLRGLVRRGGTGPLSSHVARLAGLHRINQAATASLDLEAMLRTVVDVVKQTVAADSCSIFLYDQTSGTLVLRATVGLNQEEVGQLRLPLGVGITGEAAATRRILAVAEARSHPAYLDHPRIGDQIYTSQVSVPLALGAPDRLVGVLNILSAARREFDADELAFLETAAGEIAIAIENARLYSETDAQLRRRISQLATLQQMSRMVASTLDLSEVLRLISRQTAELSQATAAEIYRRPRHDPTRLELMARHPSDDAAPVADRAVVVPVVEEAMQTGAAIWRRLPAEEPSTFLYVVPMVTARRAVGAICVYLGERPQDAQDMQGLLDAFSDSAAIAIENAELYEEALRGFTRASTLLQEMHHRVRNNLQMVAALLSMQARHAADEGWTQPLQEAVSRIRSIAAIHDLLSSGNLRETTVERIAKHVVDEAIINVVPPGTQVNFVIEPSPVHVPSRQATVLALLINEFLANAVVHGVARRERGEVIIGVRCDGDEAVLEVCDDGVGLPEGFDPVRSAGLGLQIARTLVEVDLHGSLHLRAREGGGTVACVRFPLPTGGESA